MPVSIRFDIDHAAVQRMLTSPDGPVGREVRRVTNRVAVASRALAPVQDGRLKSSVRTSYRTTGREVRGIVYSDLDYSLYVQRGTGIYGPSGRPIRPRRAPFLVFPSRRGGGLVFAREVRGQEPQPFMVRALRAESPWPVTVLST